MSLNSEWEYIIDKTNINSPTRNEEWIKRIRDNDANFIKSVIATYMWSEIGSELRRYHTAESHTSTSFTIPNLPYGYCELDGPFVDDYFDGVESRSIEDSVGYLGSLAEVEPYIELPNSQIDSDYLALLINNYNKNPSDELVKNIKDEMSKPYKVIIEDMINRYIRFSDSSKLVINIQGRTGTVGNYTYSNEYEISIDLSESSNSINYTRCPIIGYEKNIPVYSNYHDNSRYDSENPGHAPNDFINWMLKSFNIKLKSSKPLSVKWTYNRTGISSRIDNVELSPSNNIDIIIS